jgi:hypothetical protein
LEFIRQDAKLREPEATEGLLEATATSSLIRCDLGIVVNLTLGIDVGEQRRWG